MANKSSKKAKRRMDLRRNGTPKGSPHNNKYANFSKADNALAERAREAERETRRVAEATARASTYGFSSDSYFGSSATSRNLARSYTWGPTRI